MPEPKKILIVEDEKSLIDVMQKAFEKEGFSVITAMNGQEGFDAAVREQPDMIILDILMPVMDGITMIKKLRDEERAKEIPIIILTNLNYIRDLESFVHFPSHVPTGEGNISDFLVKTEWKLEDMIDKVKEKLSEDDEPQE